MSCPNYNLILNYISLPRRFSSQECKMENALSYQNWPENLIMTLFPTDGILLEICNQKERYRAWSLVTTTSHIWTFSMLFSKTRRTWALPYSFQTLAIWPDLGCVSPMSVEYTPCFLLSSSYIPEVLQLISLLPPPQPEYRYCPPCIQPFSFGWSSEVVSEHALKLLSVCSFCTNGGCHPLTLELEQQYHVYVCDSSTEGEATW
jgi:hypothetical protein